MGGMTEQLVSLEVAKLLKEKGFNEYSEWGYDFETNKSIDLDTLGLHLNSNIGNKKYTVPTQSLAQKWLRKKYGIYFQIMPIMYNNRYRFGFECIGFRWNKDQKRAIQFSYRIKDSYEEALEDGLKGALETLKLV